MALKYDRRILGVGEEPPSSKDRILDAARSVLNESGYEHASINEISRRAELPVGSIYHHFGSKAGLFVALMTLFAHEFWTRFEHTATAPDSSLEERLQEFVDDTRDNVSANHQMFVLTADLSRLRVNEPELDMLLAANTDMAFDNTCALLTRILRPGEPASTITEADIPTIARVLLRYSRGATLEFRNDPKALAESFADYHYALRRIAQLP